VLSNPALALDLTHAINILLRFYHHGFVKACVLEKARFDARLWSVWIAVFVEENILKLTNDQQLGAMCFTEAIYNGCTRSRTGE